MNISMQPRPNWAPLTRPGCTNVEFRVLLDREGIVLANLRFNEYAEIDEHDAPVDIDVVVVTGSGFVSVEGTQAEVAAGQTISWPKGKMHKLWTTTSSMETIMIERVFQLD